MSVTLSHPQICLEKDNVVYLWIPKCACRFFGHNFSRHMGWKKIAFSSINWENQIVFAHINDPIQRRHKAIAELIDRNQLSEFFLANVGLQKLLTRAMRLDEHSFTYYDMFQERIWNINWIPLIHDYETNIHITEKFLSSHGIDIKRHEWNRELVFPSSEIKKQVENTLNDNWNRDAEKNSIWQQFYQAVKDSSWPECVDYKNFAGLPEPIKNELRYNHNNPVIKVNQSQDLLEFEFDFNMEEFYQRDLQLWAQVLKKFK